ncbi:MAG: FecR domain-containing protein [Planctomycetota bacterium]
MNDKLVETCLAYLDGDLDEAELKDFADLLAESDEAADQLADLALDEQHYRQAPAGPKAAELPLADALAMPALDAAFNDGVPTIQYTTSSTAKPQSQYASALAYVIKQTFTPKRVAVLGTAAVVLLGLVITLTLISGPDETEQITDLPGVVSPSDEAPVTSRVVATLTAEHQARWDRRPGQDLYAGQRFTLRQGFAEVTTARGASVLIEAPSTVSFSENDNAVFLREGSLGITIGDNASGFIVDTPHTRVVDIGTSFGVSVVPGTDTTHVQVFEGEVSIAPPPDDNNTDRSRTLVANGAVEIGLPFGVRPAEFEPTRYERDIAIARLRPGLEGDAEWAGEVPSDIGFGQFESVKTRVHIEQAGLVLGRAIQADFGPGGTWPLDPEHEAPLIPAGTRVDVYLLHLDPPSTEDHEAESVIRFDRPILGVLGTEATLHATDSTLGLPGVLYPNPNIAGAKHSYKGVRGLDFTDTGFVDHAAVAADGRTITLSVNGSLIDQARVLVLARDQGSPTTN